MDDLNRTPAAAVAKPRSPELGSVTHRPNTLRLASVVVRTAHITVAAAVLGFVLCERREQAYFFSWAVVGLTGLALFFLDWLRHRQALRETWGAFSLLKVFIAALISWQPDLALIGVLISLVGASLISHAPRRWRHRLLWGVPKRAGQPDELSA